MIVLLVDDDRVSRRVLRRLLSRFPELDMRDAENGQVAWTLLGDFQPALIFCDLFMPLMDGVTLIRKIREHPTFGTIPIIVTSANKDREMVVELKDLRIDDYLLKPFDLVQTFARLEKQIQPLLERYRAEQAAAAAQAAAEARAEAETAMLPASAPEASGDA